MWFRSILRLLRHVSAPQLIADSGRMVLTVAGVASGIALVAAIGIINESVLASFRGAIEAIAGPADLQIVLGVGEVGFSESVVDSVRADPAVQAAVPLVRGTISLAEDPTITLQLFGADLVQEEDLDRYRIDLASDRRDASAALTDPESIFLTTQFAGRRKLRVGSPVVVLGPLGIRTLTVRGLLEGHELASAYGGYIAVMDIAAAQALLRKDERIDQVDIVLFEHTDAVVVRDRLETRLPSGLNVSLPEQHGAQYDRVLASFQAMLSGLSSLCLIAGLFIIYNTSSTAALRRASTIADLKLMGASRKRVLALLTVEAMLLGVAGSALGIALGVPLAWLLSGTISSSMGVIFQLRFPIEKLALDSPRLAAVGVLGVLVSVFASSFAARRLMSLDPLTMMRGELSAPEDERSSVWLIWCWILLVAASVGAFTVEYYWKSIAWGNFGSTLWNAGVVVVAIPLVRGLSRTLSHVLPKWFGAEGTIAAASLFRAGTRTGVTVAAIALILTIATLLSSLVLSCRLSLAHYFAGFFAADLTVSAVSTEGGWLETPLSPEVGDRLVEIPGVARVDTARVLAGQQHGQDRIALLALSDALFDPSRVSPGWYREGDASTAAPLIRAGVAVNVSTSFADRFHVHAGDALTLTSPTGPVSVPVVGVVPDYVSDRGSVIMSRKLLANRWQETNVNRFLVSLTGSTTVARVRERILEALGPTYRLKILSNQELLDYHTGHIDRAFAVMNSVQLLIIIVTVVGIFDLLLSRIMERRNELAVWRVIGASKRSVRKAVMVESVTIGAIGAILGVAVGAVTAWGWVMIHFRYLLGYFVEYHLAVGAMCWYVTLVLVMTLAAGRAAATAATRQSILEGIHNE